MSQIALEWNVIRTDIKAMRLPCFVIATAAAAGWKMKITGLAKATRLNYAALHMTPLHCTVNYVHTDTARQGISTVKSIDVSE